MLRGSVLAGCLLACGILLPIRAGGEVTCTANVQSIPTLRREGLTELPSDLVLDCTGSTTVRSITIQLQFNTKFVTPRQYSSALSSDPKTEAILFIDDPDINDPYVWWQDRYFFGRRSTNYSLLWQSIPFTSPPAGGRRRLRFKNLRVDAADIDTSGSGRPGEITVSASSSELRFNGLPAVLAQVRPGLEFSLRDGRNPNNPLTGAVVAAAGLSAPIDPAAWLRFTEGFEGAFRPRGGLVQGRVDEHSWRYMTESGILWELLVAPGDGVITGLADFGTRVAANFANIPRGVHVWVGVKDVGGTLQLTADEAAVHKPLPATRVFGVWPVVEVGLSGGAGKAAWEVMDFPKRPGVEPYNIPIFFTTDSTVSPGAGTVMGRFGPVGNPTVIDRNSPIPRFADTGTTLPLVTGSPPVAPLTVSCNPAAGPATVGSAFTAVCAASGGQGPFQWSISAGTLPPGLSLSPAGAAATISGTPTAAGAYRFTVTVQDLSGPSIRASQEYSGTIASSLPALTVVCDPAAGPATVGTAYSTTCRPTGGKTPYQWSIGGGGLPSGLSMSFSFAGLAATVAGTPTAAGAYRFTVVLQDSSVPPNRAEQAFSGTIAAPTPITIACVPPAGPAVVGAAYSTTCTAANGAAPFRWSIGAGALPAGLALGATTGAAATISGTPSAAGDYDFTVTATDSTGSSASRGFAGTLAARLGGSCSPRQGPAAVGTAYSTSCRAEGGTAPYHWSIREGRLPDGLAFSATTGAAVSISGMATTAGSYSFIVEVTDSSNPRQSYAWLFTGTLPVPFETLNAAGFLPGPIAPDSIASLYGTGLALRTESSGGSIATTLGGASVKVIDSVGAARDAQLFYASENQINFLVPRETAAGAAAIRVTKTGSSFALSGDPVSVANVAPGIFVVSGGSKVPAAFYLRVRPEGERTQSLVFDPATLAAAEIPRETGDKVYLLLYGTGFRGCQGRARATANGQEVPVLAAVAQSEFAGLDQVNIGPLPESLPSGIVTVRLEFASVPANDITVRLK